MISHSDEHIKPSFFIGIGASAGGLEALQKLIQYMPTDSGAAIIIVQHLSPHFKNTMDELLARHTDLPIYNATDGQLAQANCIYLAPPRKNVLIAKGRLLVDQMASTDNNFPIDIFFCSLAEDQHHRTIAVILSGTGSDGSRGIQAVKEVGGLVIVQDPSDAKFDGMPCNAIKKGFADAVCLAETIPARIIQYITHPVVSGLKPALPVDTENSDRILQQIYELLREKSNIDFTLYKGSTIYRRIERRLGINGLNNVQDYYALLLRNQRELQTLSKDMLIGVTRFFRDSEAFVYLEQKVIPEIFDKTPLDEPIRIWVAGCSTGEETYSLAILFDEAMRARNQIRSIKIFATDVDSDAIAEASNGRFDLNISSDVNADRLKTYFIKHEEHYTVIPALRHTVVFATHNLLKDPPFSNCQLAVCRNVLIYFRPKTQKCVLTLLHFALKKQGFMFLGSSESLGDMQPHFLVLDERNKIFRKVTNARLMVESIPGAGNAKNLAGQAPSVNQLLNLYQQNQKQTPQLPVYERLIEVYAPACIILSEELIVSHVFGNVEPYTTKLKSGRFSANIKDFIAEGLSIAVTTALYRAQSTQQSVFYENIHYTQADTQQDHILNLRVLYINGPANIPQLAVVFEQPSTNEAQPAATSESFDSNSKSHQLIQDLEEALRKKQEHLQITVEELQTTNEELQSSNEELLAANEELQSTNAELQSVNEELYSVNSEFQEKITEISQSNQDLDNIINSANISFILLDDSLSIRKFSPNATTCINLLHSDIGRPFHHISHLFNYELFLADIAKVLKTEKPIETEVTSHKGGQYLVKISPYFDQHHIAMGCVICVTDIGEIKTLKQRLLDSWKELRSTLDTSLLTRRQTLKVLVVDDDELDREAIKRAIQNIRSPGAIYDLYATSSFEGAEELLNKNTFDVCIIDHYLRGEHSGLELVKHLKARMNAPAFILLSGNINEKLVAEAIELGIYDTIDKQDISPALIEHSLRYTQRHRQTERFLADTP